MAIEIYLRDKNRLLLDQMEFVSQQNIHTLIRNLESDNQQLVVKKIYMSQTDYYYAYQYEKKYHKMMKFDVKMNQVINIERMSDNLDIYYLIDKLKTLCNAMVQSKISSVEYNLNKTNAIIDLCKKFDLSKHPELAIYYYRYWTLLDGDNFEHYHNLKNIIEKNAHQIPQSEAIEIFESALSYCIGRANKGDKKFLPEYFELFLNGIDNGVFVVNGELASWRFNNIVVVGLRLGKLDWAEEFVKNHKHLLSQEVRQNIVGFNLARIASYKKNYQLVLDLIRDVEYEDIIINLTSKSMILFAYYELDEFDLLDSFIESFRTFINRKKDIQSDLKERYLHFLRIVRKIMRIPIGDKKAIEKIKNEIIADKLQTVNKEWLLQKINELE